MTGAPMQMPELRGGEDGHADGPRAVSHYPDGRHRLRLQLLVAAVAARAQGAAAASPRHLLLRMMMAVADAVLILGQLAAR